MLEKTIDLQEPIVGHDGPISQITLRQPGFREIMRLGEPVSRIFTTDGTMVSVTENIDVIRQYIEALVRPPANPLLIEQLRLADTMRIKDAVLSFFQPAEAPKTTDAKSTS